VIIPVALLPTIPPIRITSTFVPRSSIPQSHTTGKFQILKFRFKVQNSIIAEFWKYNHSDLTQTTVKLLYFNDNVP